MICTRRLAVALFAGAAGAGLLVAGPATADTPLPPSGATFCPDPIQEADGSIIAGQEANGAGCVVVHLTSEGATLESVIVAPNWTYRDDSSGDHAGGGSSGGGGHGGGGGGNGQSGRAGTDIDIVFTQPTTGQHVEVQIRPGRTIVK